MQRGTSGNFASALRQLLHDEPSGRPTAAVAPQQELDDDTRSMIGSYEQAMSTGSAHPLVKTFGMGRIANLLQGVAATKRTAVVTGLFSGHPDRVREALRTIALEHRS